MIGLILILLLIFWFLGYIRFSGLPIPDLNLFTINGQGITLYQVLIFLLIAWAIGILPSPFREIASIALLLWVLATLGIIAVAGLSSIIVLAVILGLVASF